MNTEWVQSVNDAQPQWHERGYSDSLLEERAWLRFPRDAPPRCSQVARSESASAANECTLYSTGNKQLSNAA